MPRFYDLHVQSRHGAGDDTVQELADRANRLGLDALAITDPATHVDDLDDTRGAVDVVESPVDVRLGALIEPDDPGALQDCLSRLRDHVTVIAVQGGDAAINRAACEDSRVDVLAEPFHGRSDPGVDHKLLDAAAANRVALQLPVRPLLQVSGKKRAHRLNAMRQIVRLCGERGAPVITASAAKTVRELRAPRDMAALPRVLGMDLADSMDTVTDVPAAIVRRADQARDDAHPRPGVEVESTEQEAGDADG